MDANEKLKKVKVQLPTGITFEDETILEYLDLARLEILGYMYGGANTNDVTEVPDKYAVVQINAVLIALGLIGGTGETAHTEVGTSRTFKYSDMVEYIRKNVFPIARFI